MRTLQFGLRVADLDRSLAFCTAVGYEVVGTVPGTAFGDLTMLKLPDDEFVMIELVSGPSRHGALGDSGLSHFVLKVESLEATMADLAAAGLDVEAPDSPDGTDEFLTTWITDPDGNRIELVQWPAGHAGGITPPTGPADTAPPPSMSSAHHVLLHQRHTPLAHGARHEPAAAG